MATRDVFRRLPGSIAALLVVGATTAAAVTGAGSLFYEAWGQPVLRALAFLAPAALLMAVGLAAIRRPGAGTGLLLAFGLSAGWLWMRGQMARGLASFDEILLTALVMTAPLILAALLFLFEARRRRLLRDTGGAASGSWIARNWAAVIQIVVPVAAVVAMASQQLPALLARHDDGARGPRIIASGAETLVWAPRGPGWNARSSGGEYLTWKALVRHGTPALERCAYVDAGGKSLLDRPVGVWRMPTVHEIVRALSRGGANAGCTWDGRSPHTTCRTAPDKETPLWAPDEAPIYYWAGQEATAGRAFAVNCTGGISVLPKSVEGLGVGFRCVKAAGPISSSGRASSR